MKDVQWQWLILSVILAAGSHLSRAYRWQMMLETLPEVNKKPRFGNLLMGIMAGYLVNMAVPRAGEITRCTLVSRYEKISFQQVLGTLFNDRILDVVFLLFFTALSMLLQWDIIQSYTMAIWDTVSFKLSQIPILIFVPIVLLLVGLFFLLRKIGKSLFQKIIGILKNIFEGVLSITRLQRKGEFILHSILIWGMYLLMLYVCFFAIPATQHLGIVQAIVLLSFGTFGFLITPGGLGAYPIIVASVLALYDIDYEIGLAFGWLVWGFQTCLNIIWGLLSFALLPIFNRNKE